MPIYEYLCPKCTFKFELKRSFGEAEKPATCPKCKSKAQKLISGFACKTGGSIQSSPSPFREKITESVWEKSHKDSKEKHMGTKGRKNVKKPKKQDKKK